MKAQRNKTIDTAVADGGRYLDRCVQGISSPTSINQIMDKTILADTFESLGLLPHNSFDLIIADPPYNLTKSYNGNVFLKRNNEEYKQYTRSWLQLVAPLLKTDGSIYVCCDWQTSTIISQVLPEFFQIRNRITWQREKGRGAKANWKNGMEDIWYATKGANYTFNLEQVKVRRKVIAPYRTGGQPKDWTETSTGNYRDTCPSNFWDDITIPFWSMPENTAHPTQKSEKLIARIVLASSSKGDIILDPFLGSGTTSVVAKKLGRHYVGIEIDPQYCIWAEQRLAMADEDDSIQGYSGGIFWERNSLPQQKRASKIKQPEIEMRSTDSANSPIELQQSFFKQRA